jgi:hypothetical protein
MSQPIHEATHLSLLPAPPPAPAHSDTAECCPACQSSPDPWRFTGTRTLSETSEARAQKAVAVSFFLLAPYLANG